MEICSNLLRTIKIPLEVSFLKGRSQFLILVRQGDGFVLPSTAFLTRTRIEEKTGNQHTSTVAILLNGEKTFSFKANMRESKLAACLSAINFANTFNFPITLSLNDNKLIVDIYSSSNAETDQKLLRFYELLQVNVKD
ncbi:MAG: hypothetical protein IJ777_04415 [Clostridia bacterium]|nr:hypothetical protein [Clostridia bacterium]